MQKTAVQAVFMLAGTAFLQSARAAAPAALAGQAACRACHKEADQISSLARGTPEGMAARASAAAELDARGPATILLDMLKGEQSAADWFGPVPFNHAGHAGMSGSCTVCHHYTPEGQSPAECRTCHEPQLLREDIRKPSLKGAYHRQCLSCHRAWEHEDHCATCHLPKDAKHPGASATAPAFHMAKDHPVIARPVEKIYRTELGSGLQSAVLFRHHDHIERYGNRCTDCHQNDSCLRCHDAGAARTTAPAPASSPSLLLPGGQEAAAGAQVGLNLANCPVRHESCAACHRVDDETRCGSCHQSGEPRTGPFDHAITGWPLEPYHQRVSCRECHRAGPMTLLDANCSSCHLVPTSERAAALKVMISAGGEHPHEAWYEYIRETGAADLCIICHQEVVNGPRGTRHPMGWMKSPVPEALVQAGARLPAGTSELSCLTCHSTATSRYEPIALAEGGPDALCLACHPQQSSIFGTLHDIRVEAPAGSGAPAPAPAGGGTCRTCHPAHRPARPPAPTRSDPNGQCTACHQPRSWGQGKGVSAFPHPDTACSDCHNPHEPRHGQFLAQPAGQLCTGCHSAQAGVMGGPHDPACRPDGWPDKAAAARGACLACHIPHGNQSAGLLRFAQPSAANGKDEAAPARPGAAADGKHTIIPASDATCLACHPSAGWGTGGDHAMLHPRELGKRVNDLRVQASSEVGPQWLATDASGKKRMACQTCHDVHAGAKPRFLTRGSPEQPAGLCLGCHEEKKLIEHTGHSTERLMIAGANVTHCQPCHAMHAKKDASWGRMLSPRFLEAMNPGAPVVGDQVPCLACHRADGPAPVREVASHPRVVIPNVVTLDAPGYLPLFDAAGHVSPDGQINCRTCHLSHGRLDLLQLAAEDKPMSEQERRSMRLNLRSFVAPNFCTQCHGEEARLRFLLFHDVNRRDKLAKK